MKIILITILLCITLCNCSMLKVQLEQLEQEASPLRQNVITKLDLTNEVDYTFDIKNNTLNNVAVDYAPFLFGSHVDSKTDGNIVHMHVDTSVKYIALGDMSAAGAKLDWGLDCSLNSGSNCIESTTAAKDCNDKDLAGPGFSTWNVYNGTQAHTYWPAKINCRTATTFMRWTNDTLSEDADKVNTNLKI